MRGTPDAIGTRKATPRGHIMVKVGKGHPYANAAGWQYEHRLVMMEKLERPLVAGELVVHVNGDRCDNRIENLQLLQPKPSAPHCATCTC